MNKKIFVITILLIISFCVAPVVLAEVMTTQQREAKMAQLRLQIAQLQLRIAQLTGSAAPKCTSNWQIGSWSICTGNKQTRITTDLNNCSTPTSRPVVTQSCSTKPIDISANGSDGPLNIFLTVGNGATPNGAGVNLTSNVNLQWAGTNVSSCVASDTAKPTVFSGHKAFSGNQTVTLSGTIPATASTNKISANFKMSCVSTISGSQVSDNITVNLFYTVDGYCNTNWQCQAWSACVSGRQTRTCTDYSGCGSLTNKPAITQVCTQ